MEQPICTNGRVELKFDLQFKPFQQDYFGYVFRLILDDKLNIDLIYDRRKGFGKHFKLVIGDRFTDIAFDIDPQQLFYKWNAIRLVLDTKNGLLTLQQQNQTYKQQLDFKGLNCLKLFFGLNNFKVFQSSDVPPMRIKDIVIQEDDRLIRHWPLDETSGTVGLDKKNGGKAVLTNPVWIKRLRQEWRLQNELKLSGQASVAFDAENEALYVVGQDSLVQTFVGAHYSRSWAYYGESLHLVNGSQSIFDPLLGKVHNISIDQRIVSTFDTLTRKWTENFRYPADGTNFLHFNKFYAKQDSSIYMIGGYGHFAYKNGVHRYHIPSQTWDSIPFSGDKLFPHYLGALGVASDGVYLLGGYGSATGDQMLNPRMSSDLIRMDVGLHTFERLFEMNLPSQESVWANSLVVDSDHNMLYGLVFPRNKFKSHLQLNAIPIKGKGLHPLGNLIPFDFHDIRSFADLYYAPASKCYLAVTLFYDSHINETRVRIYTLLAPGLPYDTGSIVAAVAGNGWYWALGTTILLIITGLLYIFRYRKVVSASVPVEAKLSGTELQDNTLEQPATAIPPTATTNTSISTSTATSSSSTTVMEQTVILKADRSPLDAAAIFLFRGDIQVYDQKGKDITNSFSPLLKEMLTMFVVFTIYRGRGISSEKLTELFWADKSTSSARNNRSVNIAKINALLERLGNVKIAKKSGYWCLENDEQVYIDFFAFNRIYLNRKDVEPDYAERLLKILDKGGFMFETDYEWLDSVKDEVSIQVISLLSEMMSTLSLKHHAEAIVDIANRIFHFDPVNEEAMIFKCKALAQLGYHSLALQCYDNFCQIYTQMYGERYQKSYRDILV